MYLYEYFGGVVAVFNLVFCFYFDSMSLNSVCVLFLACGVERVCCDSYKIH